MPLVWRRIKAVSKESAMMQRCIPSLLACVLVGVFCQQAYSSEADRSETAAVPAANATSAAIAAYEPVRSAAPAANPCAFAEVTANPTRPAWDLGASTTQCGILESDFGFLRQPAGAGISQQMVLSSMRYGITPRLDLRWGITNHIWQSGAGASLQGSGDQWINARYRFHEQGRWTPALSLDYGVKLPFANPAKGLGSGFVDHQFIFIASRDLGHTHLDFNTVGTLAGGSGGHEGAAQSGLAVTRPLTKNLSAVLESYGGPQPGTTARYGAALAGGMYSLRSWLTLDAAVVRAYTAGSPRQQILFGITYARRPGGIPIAHHQGSQQP